MLRSGTASSSAMLQVSSAGRTVNAYMPAFAPVPRLSKTPRRAFPPQRGNTGGATQATKVCSACELPEIATMVPPVVLTALDFVATSQVDISSVTSVYDECSLQQLQDELNGRLAYWADTWVEVRTCIACQEAMPLAYSAGSLGSACCHTDEICLPCLRRYAVTSMDSAGVQQQGIPCQQCRTPLEPAVLSGVLTPGEMEKYLRLKRAAIIDADPQRRWSEFKSLFYHNCSVELAIHGASMN